MDKKYSVVVFDMGNVLLPFDYNIAIERLDKIEYGIGKKFHDYYLANYNMHRQFEKGEISEEQFTQRLLSAVNNKIDKETFCKIYSEIFSKNDNVISLLPILKKNYKLVLLSNTNSIHKKYGFGHFQFLKIFDKEILSYEVKSVKPEEKIYHAVEDYTKEPPNKHLYIDDIKEYTDAAKKLGWDSIQFKEYDNLVEALKLRGVL
jgi:putative hydrolase of the HAD superfamily